MADLNQIALTTKENPLIEDAVVTMYEMSAEDAIREQCLAAEEYYRTINTLKAHIDNRGKLLEQHISRQHIDPYVDALGGHIGINWLCGGRKSWLCLCA